MRRKLANVTNNGTYLERLKTLAGILAKRIDAPSETDNVAQLSKQYRDTIAEIDRIEGSNDTDDELSEIIKSRADHGKPGAIRKDLSKLS